jgi:hypothetical protein
MRSELTQMDSQSSKPAENLLYSNPMPMPWAAHFFFSPRLDEQATSTCGWPKCLSSSSICSPVIGSVLRLAIAGASPKR